ncbi:hypothetical protein BJ165DRAFT_1534308 [Panaeolus papilionaceus]|nr:hypothetical protein BJ165DRAFT_1534308 [Panaeolus papilionaceus]
MANIVMALPNSLLLLVHLHLVSYPYANKPEYDENLFASTRGLRERTKTMEDISYFLVGRLERMKDGPKALFPTYPCSRPSDTVAFRTSLAKYLEQLRHGSLYNSASAKSSNLKQTNRKPAPIGVPAVWWKEVVIRKSLLEECSGERFERLILALSTHTLMKLSKSRPISDFVQELTRQPQLYNSKLLNLNFMRQGWKQKALYLDHRAEELERLRAQLSDSRGDGKLATSSTRQIQELAKSKLKHIQAAFWMGEEGAKALELSLTLAGLSLSNSSNNSPPTLPNQQQNDISTPNPSSIVPLPVAAAHHPSLLKKFRRPIFRPAESKVKGGPTKTTSHPAEQQIQSLLQAHATMHATLVNAIAQLNLENERLFDTLSNHTSGPSIPPSPPSGLLVQLDENILFRLTNSVVDELGTPDLVARLEHRIEEIRTSILPPYPVAQDPLPERLPALEPKVKPPTGISQRLPPHNPTMNRKVSSTASPQKRSPRKSIRFSMARQARPRVSTLRVFSGGEEVNQLINSTNDLPSDNEGSDTEFDFYGTPRSKVKTPKSKQKVNRIWTASTPGERPPSTLKHSGMTSRESFPNFMDAAVSLPSLLSAEGFLGADDVDDDEDGEEEEGQDVWRGAGSAELGDQLTTPRAKSFNLSHSDEEDVNVDDDGLEGASYEEEKSMSLKDLLLSSQANFVDLMGTQAMDLGDEDQCEDDSFKWDSLV